MPQDVRGSSSTCEGRKVHSGDEAYDSRPETPGVLLVSGVRRNAEILTQYKVTAFHVVQTGGVMQCHSLSQIFLCLLEIIRRLALSLSKGSNAFKPAQY